MNAHSPLKSVSVSLVCFTRNDHALLQQSLTGLPDWSLLPREIIVVDDASEEPYAPPPALLQQPGFPPLRVLRTPRKLGYAGAKNFGLHTAASRFILSMDADITLSPRWLERCLPPASRPEIGLVSGPIIAACGQHLFGRYMALTYSFNTETAGKVKFIPGAVWLMRRELWQELGGYDRYQGDAGEDDYLCKQLAGLGRCLWIEPKAEAFEIRPMDRLHMVRRGWKWHGASVYQALAAGHSLEEAVNVLLYSLRPRMLRSKQANPLFLYYDLLYWAYALFDLSRNAARTAPLSPLLAAFHPWLAHFPGLAGALAADLTDLGFSEASGFILKETPLSLRPVPDLAGIMSFAFDQSVLNALEMNLDAIRLD